MNKMIRYVNDADVFIGKDTKCVINNVYKIIFNIEETSIDCYDDKNNLISYIYYKRINDEIYCEDYKTNKTIDLTNNGKIINKEW